MFYFKQVSNNRTILKSTSDYPNVQFDEVNNVITIEGVCMPENAVDMFAPVFEDLYNIL